MFAQVFQAFSQSPQGQNAFHQLQAQGYTPQQSAGMLSAALPTAAATMQRMLGGAGAGGAPAGAAQGPGLTDVGSSHYATNFLSAAVAGLLRGEGLMGSAVDGLQGVVGGHVAEVLAARFGLPRRVAGVAGAIVTPLMIDWLWERVRGGSLGLGELGAMFGAGAPAGAAPPAGGGFGALPPWAMAGAGSAFGQAAGSGSYGGYGAQTGWGGPASYGAPAFAAPAAGDFKPAADLGFHKAAAAGKGEPYGKEAAYEPGFGKGADKYDVGVKKVGAEPGKVPGGPQKGKW